MASTDALHKQAIIRIDPVRQRALAPVLCLLPSRCLRCAFVAVLSWLSSWRPNSHWPIGWLRSTHRLRALPRSSNSRPVILDLAGLPREETDVGDLVGAIAGRGIRIIGTEGAHPSWRGIERWGGPLATGAKNGTREVQIPDDPRRSAAAAVSAASNLILDQPIRSGQSIGHEAGDVTVVGPVAWGAEIIAGGSIHVYGALRGRAIAGLSGSGGARIFCRKLEAELLAIEGVYRTAEDIDPALHGKSAQARLEAETMIIAALD